MTSRQPPLPSAALAAAIDDARAALMTGRTTEARTSCEALLRALPHGPGVASLAAEAMRIIARCLHVDGDGDAALDCLEAAHAVCVAADDQAGAGHALSNAGVVHFQNGRLDEAERLYTEALTHARSADDATLRASTTMNLGIIANVRGDLQLALSHYKRSLADYRALGRLHSIAGTLNNIGMLHVDLGQWRLAERAYAEALTIIRTVGDLDVLARLHVNVAEMWVGRGDLARARAECDAAMEVCGRTAHLPAIGEAHKLYGVVAREQAVYVEAESHLERARETAESRNDLLLLAETAREQAELYRRQGRNADTLRALNRAHKLFDALRARRDLADIGRRVGRIEDEFVEVARRWGESIEDKDRYTQGHCKRVADLSCLIAATAGLEQQSLFWFRIGALLHDVGKLVIPEEVLNKPGKLSDDEWQLMRSHTTAGVEMLSGIEFPWDVRPIILSHHERWDGKGYPYGLKGDAIPLVARILCVADVYDALTSVRSYKRALSHDEAMIIMRKDVGSAFDPSVFAAFERIADVWAPRTAAMQRAAAVEAAEGSSVQPVPAGHDPVTRLPLAPIVHTEAARLLGARAALGRSMAALVVTLAVRGADDDLRRNVAEALSRNTRGGDLVGRLGDDEFVVLLPDTQPAEARGTADRLRDAVAAVLSGRHGGPRVLGHATIGVAVAPGHGDTPEQLFVAARRSGAQTTPRLRAADAA